MRSDIPTEFNPYTQTFGPPVQRKPLPQYANSRPALRIERRKKSRKRFYGLVTAVVIITGLFFLFRLDSDTSNAKEAMSLVKPESGQVSVDSEQIPEDRAQKEDVAGVAAQVPEIKSSSLEDAVNRALDGSKGDYGIVIKNLKTGEIYQRQQDKEYEPGSLYKLWVMAAVYDQILQGNLSEDQELSRSIAFLNRSFSISPDEAEQTEGVISETVGEALNQMITISHNYSALLLTEKIKLSTVKAYLEANGFEHSKVGTSGSSPITTPADIALFIEKVYNKKLVSPEYSQKMLDLMKKQEKNNKLPLYLPSGIEMAHKTGEIGMFSHDAGIVYTPKGDYIIVAFSETGSPKGAEERIGQVSKAVYDYFMSK